MTRIISKVLWALMYAVSLLPLKFFYILSDILAFILDNILKYRRLVIDVNLARSFPNLRYGDIKKIRRGYYKYMCDIFLESIWAISASERQIRKIVTIKNVEVLEQVSLEHKKVIILMGHNGNWELVSAVCGDPKTRADESFANNEMAIAYKKLENNIFDALFSKMRMDYYKKFNVPGSVVESNRIVRHVLGNKDKRGLYFFIADQSPLPGDRVVARFLNQPTLFLSGPEYIAKKLDLPVAYLGMNRVKRGRYEIEITKITDSAKSLPNKELIREYAKLLEKGILANKYNWLWSHKRWKRKLTIEEQREYEELVSPKEGRE